MPKFTLYPFPAYEMTAEDLAAESAERDDEQRADYLTDLTRCPDFLSEVPPNGEECMAMAAAINDGDMAELGRIYLRAAEREASEYITAKSEECGITAGEAAQRLYEIYRPAGAKEKAA